MEAQDADPEATALRETAEEIGLAAQHVELIGRLPLYRTVTGYAVTPVVGLVTPPFDLRPDEFEVAAIFEPPLAFLLDPANHCRHDIEVEGRQHHYWSMPWQGYNIWGATAGMLRSLCAVIGSEPQIG
jgi:8-oxo-dGTP pyrophosphatase MutT (NUDIX family)